MSTRAQKLLSLALQKYQDDIFDADLPSTQLSEALSHDFIFATEMNQPDKSNNEPDCWLENNIVLEPVELVENTRIWPEVESNEVITLSRLGQETENVFSTSEKCSDISLEHRDLQNIENVGVEKKRNNSEHCCGESTDNIVVEYAELSESNRISLESSDIDNSQEQEMETTETSTSTSTDSVEGKVGKTRKKKKLNKRELNKKLKLEGKEYKTYKGRIVPKKIIKPNPCEKTRCQNNCKNINEQERNAIFEKYWSLKTENEREMFLTNCLKIIRVKRRRLSQKKKHRTFTCEYYIPDLGRDGQKKVCLQFILKTLDISHRHVRTIISKISPSDAAEPEHPNLRNKIPEEDVNRCKMFIENLPAVPSHYCRGSSNRKYLPSDVKSFENVYKKYTQHEDQLGRRILKKSTFMAILRKNYNIGIHTPKKDKCVKCESFKNNPDKNDNDIFSYKEHINEKDKVKKIFLDEQENAKNNDNLLVASFDLQKVLTTPHGDSMLIGFSRKYAVYNFTVYETGTRRGYCYIWEEKNGKRGGNEICTCLYLYLQSLDANSNYKSVSLYCDNCAGQNKNKLMLSMIQYFINRAVNIKVIKLTYLVTGHTYMPVDSMHAVIERSTKNVIVQAPSEWRTILANARKKPEPYNVKVLSFSDFLDWKFFAKNLKLKNEKNRDVKVSEVKVFEFKTDSIFYKMSFTEDQLMTCKLLKVNNNAQIKSAYSEELSINPKKLENLRSLCINNVIKPEYHNEYLTLKCDNSVPDVLDESDVEDD